MGHGVKLGSGGRNSRPVSHKALTCCNLWLRAVWGVGCRVAWGGATENPETPGGCPTARLLVLVCLRQAVGLVFRLTRHPKP